MANLDPRIEAVRAKYDLSRDDFWQIPQNKQWVCKHSALEIVAVKAGVWWTDFQIVQADTANGIAVMIVKGTLGERVEWATGEASQKNCKNAYPWAMAEKRAKDRVVLKLVGIHGLVYSEDEADDFKAPVQAAPAAPPSPANDKPKSSAQLKRDGEFERVRDQLANDMVDVHTFSQFEKVKEHYRADAKKNGWNNSFLFGLSELFGGYEQELTAKIEAENALMNSPLAAGE
jgi:hypothetical protein